MNAYSHTAESDAQWEEMHRKMEVAQSVHSSPVSVTSPMVRVRILAVAAVLLLVCGLTWNLFRSSGEAVSPSYFVSSTGYGEKSKITLTDGTAVWLNAGSSLRYSNGFGTKDRDVFLQGEAYFEVTSGDELNFVVHTDSYDVVVKGTKFNVSAYADDPVVTTTLLEGSVGVSYGQQWVQLHPGEALNFIREERRFTRNQVDAGQANAWMDNRIEYADITLKELVAKLSRQYNVTIELAPSAEKLADKSFRISLRNGETIHDVLSALKIILPLSIVRKDQYILLQ